MSDDAYFTRVAASRFMPSDHTRGAWSVDEQHFSPLAGLITHEVEGFVAGRGADGLLVSRLSFDILGTIALVPMDIAVTVVRAGRTIELLEAVLSAGGRAAVRALVWRLVASDTADVAGGAPPGLPDPASLTEWRLSEVWQGGYIESIEVRPVSPPQPGRTAAWIRSRVGLVAGEECSGLARYLALIDTANGIAVRRDPRTLLFPNVDTIIHLFRQPDPAWTGLDTTVVFGPTGQGVTSTTLHDVNGAVGRAEQMLTVRHLG